jgi:hypothetical protein
MSRRAATAVVVAALGAEWTSLAIALAEATLAPVVTTVIPAVIPAWRAIAGLGFGLVRTFFLSSSGGTGPRRPERKTR